MSRNYGPEFRKRIVRLHLEEGRTYKSICDEYNISKASISKWCREFSKENLFLKKAAAFFAKEID